MGLPLLVYVCLSIVMGVIGRKTAIGFVGFFILSLVITPLATCIILLITSPRSDHLPQR
ncbi:hypothetical protein [Rhodospirillum sp. A1_3_36]|uniref:hypothetical protein n=1 Tax=Rhodospirillum sp. A1_3_36 TaxID=3391666 RepID=UPI0039A5EADF